MQGSNLDSYFSSKADAGPGEGLSLPIDAANGLKSALGGATDAVTSAQDSASAAAKSLAEGTTVTVVRVEQIARIMYAKCQ